MNKRQQKKQARTAKQKVIAGRALNNRERAAFNRYMENWLGYDTIREIKTLFGG